MISLDMLVIGTICFGILSALGSLIIGCFTSLSVRKTIGPSYWGVYQDVTPVEDDELKQIGVYDPIVFSSVPSGGTGSPSRGQ